MGELAIIAPPGAAIVAAGQPVPQPRVRVSMRGGFARAYVPKTHPVTAWREEVVAACREAMRRRGAQADGPVAICMEFVSDRPAGHWTTKGELSAAGRRAGAPPGDWDNLAKAVQDAVVDSGVIEDDRIVTGPNVVMKRWGSRLEEAGVTIFIAPASEVTCVWSWIGKEVANGC